MCRKKRGRFIPCRGGGTATTYYMAYHDVDEDRRTIGACGAMWNYGTAATGVTTRNLWDSSSAASSDVVASRLIYLS